MSTYIHNIVCQVPKTYYHQTLIMQKMKEWIQGSKKIKRYIHRIYTHSGIVKRHSVIRDWVRPTPDPFFTRDDHGHLQSPGTKKRNDYFIKASKPMFISLAHEAIASCPTVDTHDITHLITVSCTGFYNPGPDHYIVQALGLNKDIQRYNIGFMGCYAAISALRMAQTICLADPKATVLLVSVELCSLHLQFLADLDSLLAGAVFADGGAAAIVSSKHPPPFKPVYEIKHFQTALFPEGEEDMKWTIGDHGFDIVLSQNIPAIIENNLFDILNPILKNLHMTLDDIDVWAVHPGGKSILDNIESSLGRTSKLVASRSVLSNFGNMSSATILFVLKEILQKPVPQAQESVLSLAFGPGLTVETALLQKLSVPSCHRRHSGAQQDVCPVTHAHITSSSSARNELITV